MSMLTLVDIWIAATGLLLEQANAFVRSLHRKVAPIEDDLVGGKWRWVG